MTGSGAGRSTSPGAGAALGLLLVCILAVLAAGSAAPAEIRWTEPEVRLEQIIQGDRITRPSRLRRLLTGETSRDEQLQRPYGLAWDGDELIVSDPGSRRIFRLSSKGRLRRSSRLRLELPIGVTVCARGVAVTDSGAGTVLLLDRDLRLVRKLKDGLIRPTGIACSDDRVYVLETGRHLLMVLPLSPNPPNGNDRMTHLGAVGGRGEGPGRFNYPTALALGAGTIWVGDTLNFRMQHLDAASGEVLNTFGQLGDSPGELPRIKGAAEDAGGRLWVSDAFLDQVALFSREGQFLTALGSTGSEPGQFSFPAGVAAHPDGRVAVADSFNQRVQIFRLVE